MKPEFRILDERARRLFGPEQLTGEFVRTLVDSNIRVLSTTDYDIDLLKEDFETFGYVVLECHMCGAEYPMEIDAERIQCKCGVILEHPFDALVSGTL